MLEPIERFSLTDAVFGQLKALVLEGKLRPGDQLPSERELCEQLGVSRTAIREAKSALLVTGILEARAGQGTFVASDVLDFLKGPLTWGMDFESGSIHELSEARRIIEVAAAGLAAARVTQAQKDTLKRLTGELRAAMTSNDKEGFLEADLSIHALLAEAAQNRVLVRLALAIRSLLKVFISAVLEVPGSTEIAMAGHQRLADAVQEGNVERAREAMEQHLQDVQRMIAEQRSSVGR